MGKFDRVQGEYSAWSNQSRGREAEQVGLDPSHARAEKVVKVR